MQPGCLRQTEVPHTTKLFADLLYHFDRVSGFYHYNFLDPRAYRDAAARIRYPAERRARMADALRKWNEGSPLLERFERPDTVAVVTGQQVGLFSGPCYTIYKALSAVRMAGQLTAQGIPAVPIFWLATEDHDFEEIRHCRVFGPDNQPLEVSIPPRGEDHAPVGGIAPASYPVADLARVLGDFPFGEDVVRLVERAYTPGRPLGEAFAGLLRALLPNHPMLIVDPMEEAVRSVAVAIVRDAVLNARRLGALLMERGRALADAGYHAQVHIEEKTSLVFLLRGGLRLTLEREGGDFRLGEERIAAAELAALAGQLSPNAALRPVVQDFLLPTVCYIGGPAELAYLAQSQVLYRELLGHDPVFTPRAGFTLLDSRGRKLMERYHLTAHNCLHGEEELRNVIACRLVPDRLRDSFHSAHDSVAAILDDLGGQLAAFDPTLAASLDKSRAKVLYQFSKMRGKTAREALRRDDRAAAEASHLSGLLYPHRHLQERYYTILPFLARHGLDLPDRLYENVRLDCPDHIVLAP